MLFFLINTNSFVCEGSGFLSTNFSFLQTGSGFKSFVDLGGILETTPFNLNEDRTLSLAL
jgi:hypothetical protein